MAAEYQRQRRIRLLATETPEEAAARRKAAAERMKKKLDRTKAAETPEQAAERRAKVTEKCRMRRELKKATILLMETPEQKTARLLKQNERTRRRREQKLLMETSEQAAARRSMESEYQNSRSKAKRAAETLEQSATRRAKNAEMRKKRKETRRATETPDQRAARLLIQNERRRRYRQKLLAMETPKQAATRTAKDNQRHNQRYEMRKATETPEEKAARLQTGRERRLKHLGKTDDERRAIQERKIERSRERKGIHLAETKQNSTVVRPEDGDISSSCTWSSFEPSDSSFSITTTEGSFSTTIPDEPAQHNPDEPIVIKNEPIDDSTSYFEGSGSNFVTKEIFKDNRDFESLNDKAQYFYYNQSASNEKLEGDYLDRKQTLLDVKLERDEHFIFGEYIVDRFRKCNRHNAEINFAKTLIESIMFNLSTGAYGFKSSTEKGMAYEQNKVPRLLKPPVVQAIIVKEEVDL